MRDKMQIIITILFQKRYSMFQVNSYCQFALPHSKFKLMLGDKSKFGKFALTNVLVIGMPGKGMPAKIFKKIPRQNT